ncbi:hypothetical protein [Streptomyces sp. NPDC029003]|uniref:hypothetical protein n=1 Tax=Streptomyces sp. NPDC029003 TaxID=3155125 RepID=UPI0033D24D26
MRPGDKDTVNGLRRLLNEGDPIGVADEVPDAYDCMLAPLRGPLLGVPGLADGIGDIRARTVVRLRRRATAAAG